MCIALNNRAKVLGKTFGGKVYAFSFPLFPN